MDIMCEAKLKRMDTFCLQQTFSIKNTFVHLADKDDESIVAVRQLRRYKTQPPILHFSSDNSQSAVMDDCDASKLDEERCLRREKTFDPYDATAPLSNSVNASTCWQKHLFCMAFSMVPVQCSS